MASLAELLLTGLGKRKKNDGVDTDYLTHEDSLANPDQLRMWQQRPGHKALALLIPGKPICSSISGDTANQLPVLARASIIAAPEDPAWPLTPQGQKISPLL